MTGHLGIATALALLLWAPLPRQAPAVALGATAELSIVLEPEAIVGGVPQAFTFHLVNVSRGDLRVPEPDIDCGNVTPNGGVWLNQSWQNLDGNVIAKGGGACDGSSGTPPPSIVDRARKWRLLRSGESFYIHASKEQLHYDSTEPGLYRFSAVYIPAGLTAQQEHALAEEGIAIPRVRATSSTLQYRKANP